LGGGSARRKEVSARGKRAQGIATGLAATERGHEERGGRIQRTRKGNQGIGQRQTKVKWSEASYRVIKKVEENQAWAKACAAIAIERSGKSAGQDK
jgi:hypothetical protein